MPTPEPPPSPTPLHREGLVRLRWALLVGELSAAGFAAIALGFPVSWPPLAAVVGLTALSNLALARRQDPRDLPAALLLDLGALTALLAATGGASNPFSALYLIHVALAAALLGPTWAWRVAVVAVAGFALLFPFTDPHAMHSARLQAHLGGMWAAFGVTAAGIAWFVARLAQSVRARDAEIAALRQRQERHERVLGLATLAAGVAHELGSPLGAIAVGAREIEHLAHAQPEIAEEAAAIRGAVERCRDIVGRLTRRAGAGQGAPPDAIHLESLIDPLRTRLPAEDLTRLTLQLPPDLLVAAPREALAEALAGLVHNALLAGPGPVRLCASAEAEGVRLTVEDQGEGMSPEVLARLGEPFFTTRGAGLGSGLGVFLATRLAESLGGTLTARSTPGAGTTVTLTLPGGAR